MVPILCVVIKVPHACYIYCFVFQCAEENKTSNVDKVQRLNNQKNGTYAAGPCELFVVHIVIGNLQHSSFSK